MGFHQSRLTGRLQMKQLEYLYMDVALPGALVLVLSLPLEVTVTSTSPARAGPNARFVSCFPKITCTGYIELKYNHAINRCPMIPTK